MENNTNQLYHHGVPGMKWGVRRYQNKDGSLTNKGRARMIGILGKKKYAEKKKAFSLKSNILKGKKSKEADKEEPKKKTMKELTNEELKERTTRMRLEADYINASRTMSSLNPQKVSAGRKFINHVGSNIIKPAATEAGKRVLSDWLSKAGRKYLGLDEADPFDRLKREVETLEYENRKTDAIAKRDKKEDPLADLKARAEKARLEKNALNNEQWVANHTPKASRYIKKKKK